MSEKFIRKFGANNRRDVMTVAWETSGIMTQNDKRVQITIEPITRSMEQNAKLHAMLADIAAQKKFNGVKLSLEQWKMLFVSGHRIATGGSAQMAIGLEGEVVNLRESTAKMSVARCASLIEYIQAWGAMNGVRFRAAEY
ncbi:recombination protein NinB [Wielerella bovis]|uniref:recombination protein NinB n=1 Tax=Wielerella bovis TaxID=2917790 RepID=UPI002019B40B|nr:recombination protein NinB [Wielerella bovis]MCG7657144.1 recombination protein NinB [Wielerella bovis]MCG7659367.1 recombination protein NinB [Wielerella bovis]